MFEVVTVEAVKLSFVFGLIQTAVGLERWKDEPEKAFVPKI